MIRSLSIAAAALLLSACGGGGGSSSNAPSTPPPTSPDPPPTVTAALTSGAASVSYGERVALTYSSVNAADCELRSNAPGATNPIIAPGLGLSQSIWARVYGTTTFTYTCTGDGRAAGITAQATVTVSLNTPALTYSVSQAAVNDIAWDPDRRILYLALGATSHIAPNSVAAFDPVTSTVLATSFAGSEPNNLSLNEDGTKLYVGFRTSSTVSRFSVPALTRDFTVPIPLHSAGQYAGYPDFSLDIAAAPGASEKFAVALYQPNTTGQYGRFITFDGTAPMTIAADSINGPYLEMGAMLAWADANTLLTIHGFGPSAEVARYEMQTGRVVSRGRRELSNRTPGNLVHDQGRVYTNCGHAFDATTLESLPSYARTCNETSPFVNARVAADSANDRMFFVELLEDVVDYSYGYVIDVYSQSTRELLYRARIPQTIENQLRGKVTNIERIGPDGLAMTTNEGNLLIISGPFVAPNGSSTLAGSLPNPPPPMGRDVVSFDVLLPRVADLTWDAGRQRLYAAVARDAPEHAGQIAVFQFPIPAGPSFVSRPTAVTDLDISDDGQFLYTASEDAFTFERLRLPDFTSERLVTLSGGTGDIHVAPGRPLTVVVSGQIYDDATFRGAINAPWVQWGATAERIYSYDSEGSGFFLTSYDTSGSAPTPLWYYNNIFSSVHPYPFHSRYTQSGGLLYADTGVVFDPEANVVKAVFAIGPLSGYGVLSRPFDIPFATPAWGPVAVDETRHRAYIAGCVGVTNEDLCTSFLQVYDTQTYVPLASDVLEIGGRARQLLRVGEHGFVAITYDGRAIYMAHPKFMDL